MSDVKSTDLDKNGNFIDENGNMQKAVSLENIFGIFGKRNKPQPKQPLIQQKQPLSKPKPAAKRGIKF